MSNTILVEMNRLRDELTAAPFGIHAGLTSFPSGGAMLDVRRAGRAFVMAYSPRTGFGVDELHDDDGFVSRYEFVSKEFEPAARQLKALALDSISNGSAGPSLSLVVVQCTDIDAARDFYTLLGLSFVEEQHGAGPRHYSAAVGSLVLELYPCQAGKTCAPVRIGFHVPSLDHTLAALRRRGTQIVREPKESPWGRRAVVEDPDGNRIELT